MQYAMGAYLVAALLRAMEAYAYSTQREMMYRRKIDRVNVYMHKHHVDRVRRAHRCTFPAHREILHRLLN